MGKYLEKLEEEAKKQNPNIESVVNELPAGEVPQGVSEGERKMRLSRSRIAAARYVNAIKSRPARTAIPIMPSAGEASEDDIDKIRKDSQKAVRDWTNLMNGFDSMRYRYGAMSDEELSREWGRLNEALAPLLSHVESDIRNAAINTGNRQIIDSVQNNWNLISDFYNYIKDRFELLVNPEYQKLGQTDLSPAQRTAVRNSSDNSESMTAMKETLRSVNAKDRDQVLSYLSSNFTEPQGFFSTGRNISELNSINDFSSSTMYVRNGNGGENAPWSRVTFKGGRFTQSALSPEESSRIQGLYSAHQEVSARASHSEAEMNTFINDRIGTLQAALSARTSFGRSSDNYRMVQDAVKDFRANSADMDVTTRIQMLKNISTLASNYLAGKSSTGNSAYTQARIDIMKEIASTTGDLASSLSMTRTGNVPPTGFAVTELTKSKLDAGLKHSVRALNTQPFDKERYAYMKTAMELRGRAPVSSEDFSRRYTEFLASPELQTMDRLLSKVKGPVPAKQLDSCLKAATALHNTSKELLTRKPGALATYYGNLRKNSISSYKSGNAEFDKVLNEDATATARAVLRSKEFSFAENGDLIPQSSVTNFTDRQNMLRSVPDRTMESIKGLGSIQFSSIAAGKDALAQAMFGMSGSDVNQMVGEVYSNYNVRARFFSIMTSTLMSKGMPLETIFDPEKGLQEKARIGKNLMNQIREAKTDPDKCQKLEREMLRNNMNAAPEINRFINEKTASTDVNDLEAMEKYFRSVRPLSDGIWDMICQVQVQSDSYSDALKDTLETYRNEGETDQAVIERMKKTFNDTSRMFFSSGALHSGPGTRNAIVSNMDIPEGFVSGTQSDPNSLNSSLLELSALYGFEKYNDEARTLLGPDDPDESALFNKKVSEGRGIYNGIFAKKIGPYLGSNAAFLLLTDPELKGKFNISLNNETYLKGSAEDVLFQAVDGGPIAKYTLNFDDGSRYTLSDQFTADKGGPTPEDSEAITRFLTEINPLIENRLAEGKAKRKEDLEHLASVPSASRDGAARSARDLFASDDRSYMDLTALIRSHKYNMRETPLENLAPEKTIVVGNATLDELLGNVAKSEGIDLKNMPARDKEILAAGIMASAMSRGIKVERLSRPDNPHAKGNETAAFKEVKCPASLTAPKGPAKEALDKLWQKIPGREQLLSAAEIGTPGRNAARARVNDTMNLHTIRSNSGETPETVANLPVKAKDLKAISALNSAFSKAVKGNDPAVPGFRFSNGQTLSGETAVLTLAYARSFKGRGDEQLKAGEPINAETLKDPRIALAFEQAKADLMQIREMPPQEADKAMRVSMINGLHCMRISGQNALKQATSGSISEFAKKDQIRLQAQSELLDHILADKNEPANIGLQNDRNKSMNELLKNDQLFTATDLAAMHHLKFAENVQNLAAGNNVRGSFNEASVNQAKQIALQNQDERGSLLTLAETEKHLDRANRAVSVTNVTRMEEKADLRELTENMSRLEDIATHEDSSKGLGKIARANNQARQQERNRAEPQIREGI